MDDQWKINVASMLVVFLEPVERPGGAGQVLRAARRWRCVSWKKWNQKLKLLSVWKTSAFGFHTAHYRGHRTLQTICKFEMCFLNTQIHIFKYKYQINSPGQITWLIVMSQALVAVMLPCKILLVMTTLTIILDQIRGGGDNNSKSENGANITNAGVEKSGKYRIITIKVLRYILYILDVYITV